MASPGGTSSGSSSQMQNSSSEEDIQVQILDERKRKRMVSNRESARRSRMRKQKHLDELMVQVTNLRKANNELLSNISITTQHFLKVEADNSILRAQMSELSSRLESLNDINTVLSSTSNHHQQQQQLNLDVCSSGHADEFYNMVQDHISCDNSGIFVSPWCSAAHPIMASADMFQY